MRMEIKVPVNCITGWCVQLTGMLHSDGFGTRAIKTGLVSCPSVSQLSVARRLNHNAAPRNIAVKIKLNSMSVEKILSSMLDTVTW